MIEAVPPTPVSNDFQFREGEHVLAELRFTWWRPTSRARWRLTVGEEPYELRREGFVRGAFLLAQERRILARAVKPKWNRDGFELELGAGRLALRRMPIKERRFAVFAGDREIGSIHRHLPDSRRTLVDLPAEWPLGERIFVCWLALRLWEREEAYERA